MCFVRLFMYLFAAPAAFLMLSANITVHPREPIAAISPLLHGLVVESPESSFPPAALEALSALAVPLLRWPGTGSPDTYHWYDGVGPAESRPTRAGAGGEVQGNAWGTHEFAALCAAVGAAPWLCANLTSGTPTELAEWAEYCNFAGATTLTGERAAHGAPEPFGIRHWSLGTLSGGRGAKFLPETYADAYRQFESVFPRFPGAARSLIASGPDGNQTRSRAGWTRRVLARLSDGERPRLHAWDAHFYADNLENSFGHATDFTLDEWYGLLAESLKIESLINEQRELLDASDIGRGVDLVIGGWGVRHAVEEIELEMPKPRGTLRDALVAALTLDVFARSAGKIKMATLAGSLDAGHSLLESDGSGVWHTPTFHVLDLYRGHRGGDLVQTTWDSGEAGGVPRLSGSASLLDGFLTLTVVNTGAKSPVEAEISLPGSRVLAVSGRELSSSELAARNSAETPNHVTPRELEAEFDPSENSSGWSHVFPPASVTAFTVQLAST